MAICRYSFFIANPPLQQVLTNPNFFFSPKSSKFNQLSLTIPNRLRTVVNSASSSSSMEAPPDGYRRNVGICLINSSKKVNFFSFVNEDLYSSDLSVSDSFELESSTDCEFLILYHTHTDVQLSFTVLD